MGRTSVHHTSRTYKLFYLFILYVAYARFATLDVKGAWVEATTTSQSPAHVVWVAGNFVGQIYLFTRLAICIIDFVALYAFSFGLFVFLFCVITRLL